MKKEKNILVSVKRPLSTPEGHFVQYFTAFIRGLSNNSYVLGNGCPKLCITTFPYYRSKFKMRAILS